MSSLLVFNTVYRLEIQSVMLLFSTALVNKRPSTFSHVHFPPPPLPCVNKYSSIHYIQCVTGGEMIGLCGEHILGVIHYVFDQIQNLQNCFTTPNKNLGGEGASDR
jgi:hypothetical protein